MPALLPRPPSGSAACSPNDTIDVGNLRVSADTASGLVTAVRIHDGAVLLRQTALLFAPANASGAAAEQRYHVTVRFAGLQWNETIVGLGEHGRAKGERQLRRTEWTRSFADSLFYGKSVGADVSVPFYASSRGYGFLWNSPALGSVNISADSAEWVALAAAGADFWVTTHAALGAGESPYAGLLREYAAAVGPPAPLPPWATGFIQCKDRYRNQTQLLSVARGYKQRKLPISMIVIDWFHWEEMGDFALNLDCWPDPQGMVDELRGMGIELMITMWPFMGQNVSRNWAEYQNKGYLALNTTSGRPDNIWQYWHQHRRTPTGNSLIDPTNPAAMNATFAHWAEGYGVYGVKAIWLDESEPDHQQYIGGGQWSLHAGPDSALLPAWVKYWTQGFRDGFARRGLAPGEYFLLSRNAWAGTAAHGAALWSGDIGSNWGELQEAVLIGQGVGMSGIPLWTTDIGGYHGGDPANPDFQEMIVRWFQFGAFCPLFRLHGHRSGGPPEDMCGPTNGDNEVWNLASNQERYDAMVAVMELRETLRPEVLALSQEAARSGMPIMRPMFLAFPDCAACTAFPPDPALEQQYMFGSDWLVAPVTQPNATEWPCYLPALPQDQTWEYWWNHSVVPHRGGRWVSVSTASISDFPLFRRRSL